MTHSQGLLRRGRLAYAVLALLWFAPAAYSQMKWTKIAPFPEPSEEILGATANGKMYVFAGLIPLWHPKGLVYEYDPATDKWTKKKPMALPSHHVAFTEYNGKIYAFGGFVYPQSGPAAWVPINNAWEYDPAADSWKALAPMPIKRGAALAAAAGNKIYVVGGATTRSGSNDTAIDPTRPQTVLGVLEEYDPESNTWKERSAMPTSRNHAAIGVVNGKIYVIGGRVGAAFIAPSTDVSVVEEYDPATDSWSAPLARMPTERSALAAGVYGGRILIAGGEFQDPRMMATFRVVEAYNPATNTWATLPPLPVSRHGLAGGTIGNRFYVVGGDVQSSGTGLEVSTAESEYLELPQMER
jgi:N-acetylneuraminic acid mutarotase